MDKGSYPHEQEVLLLDGKKFVVTGQERYCIQCNVSDFDRYYQWICKHCTKPKDWYDYNNHKKFKEAMKTALTCKHCGIKDMFLKNPNLEGTLCNSCKRDHMKIELYT